jgi:hypothetical protein
VRQRKSEYVNRLTGTEMAVYVAVSNELEEPQKDVPEGRSPDQILI